MPSEAQILDVGFGTGLMMERFFRAGFMNLWGVDRFKSLPGIGNKLGPDRFFNSFIEDAPLPEGFFDLAVLVHVIEHFDDARAALRTIKKALKPGGLIYIITPDGGSLSRRVFKRNWWFFSDPTHKSFFSPDSLKDLLESEGFRVLGSAKPLFDSFTSDAHSVLGGQNFPLFFEVLAVFLLSLGFLPLRATIRNFRPSLEVIAKLR